MKEGLCQSCGIMLDDEIRGTEADESPSAEYCYHCLKGGYFIIDLNMEQMVDFCSQYVDVYNQMTGKLFSRSSFRYILENLLPTLKRWTLPADQLPKLAPIYFRKPTPEEFRALNLPDCPDVTVIKQIHGILVNGEYQVNGNRIKLLDDDTAYWCSQVLKTDGSGHLYCFACDDTYIFAIESDGRVESSKIAMVKRRDLIT